MKANLTEICCLCLLSAEIKAPQYCLFELLTSTQWMGYSLSHVPAEGHLSVSREDNYEQSSCQCWCLSFTGSAGELYFISL